MSVLVILCRCVLMGIGKVVVVGVSVWILLVIIVVMCCCFVLSGVFDYVVVWEIVVCSSVDIDSMYGVLGSFLYVLGVRQVDQLMNGLCVCVLCVMLGGIYIVCVVGMIQWFVFVCMVNILIFVLKSCLCV